MPASTNGNKIAEWISCLRLQCSTFFVHFQLTFCKKIDLLFCTKRRSFKKASISSLQTASYVIYYLCWCAASTPKTTDCSVVFCLHSPAVRSKTNRNDPWSYLSPTIKGHFCSLLISNIFCDPLFLLIYLLVSINRNLQTYHFQIFSKENGFCFGVVWLMWVGMLQRHQPIL